MHCTNGEASATINATEISTSTKVQRVTGTKLLKTCSIHFCTKTSRLTADSFDMMHSSDRVPMVLATLPGLALWELHMCDVRLRTRLEKSPSRRRANYYPLQCADGPSLYVAVSSVAL
jgi:hypothetical protein